MGYTPPRDGATLFHSEGQCASSALLWFPIVFGVIGVLTMVLISAVGLPGVGPWWLWVLALVPFILLGRWEMQRSHVFIDLLEERDGGRRLRITGRGGKVDDVLVGDPECWSSNLGVPQQRGVKLYYFNMRVKTAGGRAIGFRTLGSVDYLPWPMRSPALSAGPDTFDPRNLIGIVKLLCGADEQHRPRDAR